MPGKSSSKPLFCQVLSQSSGVYKITILLEISIKWSPLEFPKWCCGYFLVISMEFFMMSNFHSRHCSSVVPKSKPRTKTRQPRDSLSWKGETPLDGGNGEMPTWIHNTLSHIIHVWYIYMPTFGWFSWKMSGNIPYMEHMGLITS